MRLINIAPSMNSVRRKEKKKLAFVTFPGPPPSTNCPKIITPQQLLTCLQIPLHSYLYISRDLMTNSLSSYSSNTCCLNPIMPELLSSSSRPVPICVACVCVCVFVVDILIELPFSSRTCHSLGCQATVVSCC